MDPRLRHAIGVAVPMLVGAVVIMGWTTVPVGVLLILGGIASLVWGFWPRINRLYQGVVGEGSGRAQMRGKLSSVGGPLRLRITNLGPEDVFSGELVAFRYDGTNTPVWSPLTWADTGEETRRIGPGQTRELKIASIGFSRSNGNVGSTCRVQWPPGDASVWGGPLEAEDGVYRAKWEFDIRVSAASREEVRDFTAYVTREVKEERTGSVTKEMRVEEADFGQQE